MHACARWLSGHSITARPLPGVWNAAQHHTSVHSTPSATTLQSSGQPQCALGSDAWGAWWGCRHAHIQAQQARQQWITPKQGEHYPRSTRIRRPPSNTPLGSPHDNPPMRLGSPACTRKPDSGLQHQDDVRCSRQPHIRIPHVLKPREGSLARLKP